MASYGSRPTSGKRSAEIQGQLRAELSSLEPLTLAAAVASGQARGGTYDAFGLSSRRQHGGICAQALILPLPHNLMLPPPILDRAFALSSRRQHMEASMHRLNVLPDPVGIFCTISGTVGAPWSGKRWISQAHWPEHARRISVQLVGV
jgi:hypothetical protein